MPQIFEWVEADFYAKEVADLRELCAALPDDAAVAAQLDDGLCSECGGAKEFEDESLCIPCALERAEQFYTLQDRR